MKPPKTVIASVEMLDLMNRDQVNNFWLPLYDRCGICDAVIVIRWEKGWRAFDEQASLFGKRVLHKCKEK